MLSRRTVWILTVEAQTAIASVQGYLVRSALIISLNNTCVQTISYYYRHQFGVLTLLPLPKMTQIKLRYHNFMRS